MVIYFEQWVFLAILAALFGGLHAFTHKIAAERGYGSGYFNALSTGVAAFIGIVYVSVFVGWTGALFVYGIALCLLSAIFYVLNANTKIEALRHIDSTVFFPISKTMTVVITALFGITLFHEQLTHLQLLGFLLSLLVPFLLIHKKTSASQKNLSKGLILLFVAALFSSGATLVNKYAALGYQDAVLFVVCTHILITLVALASGIHQEKGKQASVPFSALFHDARYVPLCVIAGCFQFLGFYTNVSSLVTGHLSLAYAIMSLQVVVPVVLSVLWYKEHFDIKKGVALAVSVGATYLMK